MKILAVADVEDRALADHFDAERWRGVGLILSLGDLKPNYLDYLVSRLNVPCFYVRGNHDSGYGESPPAGCEDANGRIVRVGGLRIAGLEGARWYGGSGVEYSDRHTAVRAFLLGLRIRLAGGIDILMTHAPPTFGDPALDAALDKVHAGFDSYHSLVLRHRPRLLLHGHTHLNYGRNKREQTIGSTRVIDCYGATLIDLDPRPSRHAAA
jgi:uncharacterized protein